MPKKAQTIVPPQTPRSNTRFIFSVIAVILLLSVMKFILVLTITDTSLKALNPNTPIRFDLVQVIDLDFPFFSETEVQEILHTLEKEVLEKLGFTVTFTLGRRIISDDYVDIHSIFIDPNAANKWFYSQLAVSKGWQNNFAWLAAIMARPQARKILESFYGHHDADALTTIIRQDFSRQILEHLEIRDIHGNGVFTDALHEGLSSSAYWHYILGEQSDGDIVICNIPIFFPSALTPVDAVTRGGLLHSMIVPSSRQTGGVIGLSTWPLLSQESLSREMSRNIFARIKLQAVARLLLRQEYIIGSEKSLLTPILGKDYVSWYTSSPGRLPEVMPHPVKRF